VPILGAAAYRYCFASKPWVEHHFDRCVKAVQITMKNCSFHIDRLISEKLHNFLLTR
jgi:hypothetical protein